MESGRAELSAELRRALEEAFARYGTVALWSKQLPEAITAGTGHAIWPTLLREGPLAARRLALRIKDLSDALDEAPTPDRELARRAS